jgi:transcriptional regulator with XRE-family HTH domain
MRDTLQIKNIVLDHIRAEGARGVRPLLTDLTRCRPAAITRAEFVTAFPAGWAEALEEAAARWPQVEALRDFSEDALKSEEAMKTTHTKEWFKNARLVLGLSQKELQEAVYKCKGNSFISTLERGERKPCAKLEAYLEALLSGKTDDKAQALLEEPQEDVELFQRLYGSYNPTARPISDILAETERASSWSPPSDGTTWYAVALEEDDEVILYASPRRASAALYRGYLPSSLPTELCEYNEEAIIAALGQDFVDEQIATEEARCK